MSPSAWVLLVLLPALAVAGIVRLLRRGRRTPAAPQDRASHPDPTVSRDFLRTICHELRSPITSVAALELIGRHGEQLSAILDDVREVADCDAQRSRSSTCSLREVVETAAACAGLPSERLRLELPAGTAFVSTWPSALGRILTNLLQNAVRYGPAGGRIVVRSRRCTSTGALEVAVLDEGAGPRNESGPPPPEAQGLGSRVVDELTASLGGTLRRQRTPVGYAVAVSLPGL